MKGLSPTQRTLRALREQGRISAICEKWNAYAGTHGVRVDLFGFLDLISLDPQRGIVGIQSCAGSGHAAHRRKILEECSDNAIEWLKCSGKIELWSWSKRKLVRGKAALRWMPRVEAITLDDFNEEGRSQNAE